MPAKPLPLNLLYKAIALYASLAQAAELKALEVSTRIDFAKDSLKAHPDSPQAESTLSELESSLRLQNDVLARLRKQLKAYQEQLHARKDEEIKSFGV